MMTYFHLSNSSQRSWLFLKITFSDIYSSFVRNVYPSFPNVPDPTDLDPFLAPLPATKGMTYVLDNLIYSLNPASLRTIRTQWENDLQCELADDGWDECLRLVHSSSIST